MSEKSVNILEIFCIKCKLHTLKFKDPASSSPNHSTQPHLLPTSLIPTIFWNHGSIQFLSLEMHGYLGIRPICWALGCLSQPTLHIFLPLNPYRNPPWTILPFHHHSVLACYLFSTQILPVSKNSSLKPQNSQSTKSCFPGNKI